MRWGSENRCLANRSTNPAPTHRYKHTTTSNPVAYPIRFMSQPKSSARLPANSADGTCDWLGFGCWNVLWVKRHERALGFEQQFPENERMAAGVTRNAQLTRDSADALISHL